MKLIIALLAAGLLTSCTSSLEKRNELQDKDTRLEKQQDVSGGDVIGVRDNKVRVQKKVQLAEELRLLENEVYGMENEVYGNRQYGTKGLYGVYTDCLEDVDSVELGGTGKLKPIEPPASVIKEDRDLEFVKDEKGDLVGISEEFLSERIDRFKKYREILGKRRLEYETKTKICQNDIKSAKARMKKTADTSKQ
jgi:hypothetical protein